MRRGVFAFVVVLVMAFGIAGCSTQSGSTSSGGGSGSSASGSVEQVAIAPDSILAFDGNEGSAKLVADMEAGVTPSECTVLYDQMGALPSVTVTDEETIREVYTRLAGVTVMGESQYSITDNYHSVSFVLQDGTRVGFNFEGEGLLSRGKNNYAIAGSGPLWAYVRTLQAGVTGGKNVYAINVSDDAGVLLDCPLTAEEGEIVRLVCSTASGEKVRVFVDGEEISKGSEIYVTVGGSEEKTPAQARKYEFFMPASDVELLVTVGS